MKYDFIVIGSGVSGARIAYELNAGGAKVLLLEAGKEFGAKTFPRNELDYSSQLFWGGGIEMSTDGRLGFLRAKVVGGTSIVNQALLDRFDDIAWRDWRSVSGVSYFDAESMEPHYKAVSKGLDIRHFEEEYFNPNARIFTRAFDKLGYGWKPLDRAQGDCKLDKGTDCIVCLGGCPRDSKQSALVTVIREGRKCGLIVEPEWEVDRLEFSAGEVRVVGLQLGKQQELTAPQVVLAAGALGNSKILHRSGLGAKLPALGTRFSCHPQLMTYAYFSEVIDAHKGAFQTVKSADPKMREWGFKLENVFAQPIGTGMLLPGYGEQHQKRMSKFRHYASMEVALRDEATGRITVGKGGKLMIDKKLTDVDRAKGKRGLELVRELFTAAGAQEIIACEQAFGLHLMGGCPIGTDPGTSVTSPEFKLHGFNNVWLADSSVFPGAPGINPSFTIMALSHRAAQGMLKR